MALKEMEWRARGGEADNREEIKAGTCWDSFPGIIALFGQQSPQPPCLEPMKSDQDFGMSRDGVVNSLLTGPTAHGKHLDRIGALVQKQSDPTNPLTHFKRIN